MHLLQQCLVNAVENPLGCYEETRFDSREAMIAQIMSVFDPAALRVRTIRMPAVRVTSAALLLVLWSQRSSCAARRRSRTTATSFPDIVEHFKYGSIGAEESSGFPYWIWRVLPTVFEDKLPQAARRRLRADRLRPSTAPRTGGRSARRSGPATAIAVGLNCATCHVGTLREAPDAPRRVIVGMPANQMDLQGYATVPDRVREETRASTTAR